MSADDEKRVTIDEIETMNGSGRVLDKMLGKLVGTQVKGVNLARSLALLLTSLDTSTVVVTTAMMNEYVAAAAAAKKSGDLAKLSLYTLMLKRSFDAEAQFTVASAGETKTTASEVADRLMRELNGEPSSQNDVSSQLDHVVRLQLERPSRTGGKKKAFSVLKPQEKTQLIIEAQEDVSFLLLAALQDALSPAAFLKWKSSNGWVVWGHVLGASSTAPTVELSAQVYRLLNPKGDTVADMAVASRLALRDLLGNKDLNIEKMTAVQILSFLELTGVAQALVKKFPAYKERLN